MNDGKKEMRMTEIYKFRYNRARWHQRLSELLDKEIARREALGDCIGKKDTLSFSFTFSLTATEAEAQGFIILEPGGDGES